MAAKTFVFWISREWLQTKNAIVVIVVLCLLIYIRKYM